MTEFSNPILGGTTLVRKAIQSENYVAGVSGWRIARDGDVEFQDGTFRGDVLAAELRAENPSTGAFVLIDPDEFDIGDNRAVIQLGTGQAREDFPGRINASFDGGASDKPTVGFRTPLINGTRNMQFNMSGESEDGSARPTASLLAVGTASGAGRPLFRIGQPTSVDSQVDLDVAGVLEIAEFGENRYALITDGGRFRITDLTNSTILLEIDEDELDIIGLSLRADSVNATSEPSNVMFPSAKLIATSPQTISTGSITELDMDSVVYDNDNMADLANNGLEIQTAGVYMLSPSIRWGPGSGTRIQIRAVVNGTDALFTSFLTPAGFNEYSVSIPHVLSVGDVVTAMCFQASGGNVDTAPGDFSPGISVTFMSAT